MSKHSAPPEANAKVLKLAQNAADEAIIATAAEEMKRQHENVLKLENAIHAIPAAMTLWKDCLILQTQPIRVMWEFFRRDKYKSKSVLGRHLLTGMLGILPDNKIAEDIHADLRLASKGNNNLRLSKTTIQDIVTNSTVIEQRNMVHAPAITEDCRFSSRGVHTTEPL